MRRLSLLLCLMVLNVPFARADEAPIPTLELGATAPAFQLPGVDGKTYSLADFAKAKVLLVVFTCNHCPTAQAYESRLKQLVEDYRDKGLALVAISPNDANSVRLDELGYTDLGDSFDEMKIRAKEAELNYPYLFEGDRTGIARAYGPTATPQAFLFDADRKLRYVGRIDDSERESLVKVQDARNAIDALLAGREVPVAKTKTFGCSIKWAGKADSVKAFMARLAAEPVNVEAADADALKALRKNDSRKLRLVNFWATWCGPCITEFPELVTINRMYRTRAFEMVTVAANFPDEKSEVLQFLKKQESSGKNLLFGDKDKYKLMEAFDPDWNASLPYTLLIAPGGEVLYKVQGPIDGLELKRRIVKALKEDRFR
jgi:thiol-disulfide isomerase/thioredoxin